MNRNGFTLAEVLITLTILLLILVAAVPAFSELINKQRADSYMQQLSHTLSYARLQAVSRQQTIILCPAQQQRCLSDWQQYPLTLLHSAASDPLHTNMIKMLPAVYPQHQLSYNREKLSFRRDGSLNALENGTFYYCPQAEYDWHYTITLNQAGRHSLQRHSSRCSTIN